MEEMIDIYMLWGQVECRYEGEYPPELLEAVDEFTFEDANPDYLWDKLDNYQRSGDFVKLEIIKASIPAEAIYKILRQIPTVELQGIDKHEKPSDHSG